LVFAQPRVQPGTFQEHRIAMLSPSRRICRLHIEKGLPMTTRQLSLPDCGSVTLTLAEPLTLDVIGKLECGLDNLLFKLRRELLADQPDPGDFEFESWAVNMPSITSPRKYHG
jgi:hypothetical protein